MPPHSHKHNSSKPLLPANNGPASRPSNQRRNSLSLPHPSTTSTTIGFPPSGPPQQQHFPDSIDRLAAATTTTPVIPAQSKVPRQRRLSKASQLPAKDPKTDLDDWPADEYAGMFTVLFDGKKHLLGEGAYSRVYEAIIEDGTPETRAFGLNRGDKVALKRIAHDKASAERRAIELIMLQHISNTPIHTAQHSVNSSSTKPPTVRHPIDIPPPPPGVPTSLQTTNGHTTLPLHTSLYQSYVSQYLGHIDSHNTLTIVLPLCSHDPFKTYFSQMLMYDIQHYMYALLCALHHIHSLGIIHRDVKPGNFLHRVGTKQYTLVDYGLASLQSEYYRENQANLVEGICRVTRNSRLPLVAATSSTKTTVTAAAAFLQKTSSVQSSSKHSTTITPTPIEPTQQPISLWSARHTPFSVLAGSIQRSTPNLGNNQTAASLSVRRTYQAYLSSYYTRDLVALAAEHEITQSQSFDLLDSTLLQHDHFVSPSSLSHTTDGGLYLQHLDNPYHADEFPQTQQQQHSDGSSSTLSQWTTVGVIPPPETLRIPHHLLSAKQNGATASMQQHIPSPLQPWNPLNFGSSNTTTSSNISKTNSQPTTTTTTTTAYANSSFFIKYHNSTASEQTLYITAHDTTIAEQTSPLLHLHTPGLISSHTSHHHLLSTTPHVTTTATTTTNAPTPVENELVQITSTHDLPTSHYFPISINSLTRTSLLLPLFPTITPPSSSHDPYSNANATDHVLRPIPPVYRAGTKGFRPPEVLMRHSAPQTTKLDIWAAGVILLCMMTRRYPFFNAVQDNHSLIEVFRVLGLDELTLRHFTPFCPTPPPSEQPDGLVNGIAASHLHASQRNSHNNNENNNNNNNNAGIIVPILHSSHASITNAPVTRSLPHLVYCLGGVHWPPVLFDLLYQLLQPDPILRPSAAVLLKHPAFRQNTIPYDVALFGALLPLSIVCDTSQISLRSHLGKHGELLPSISDPSNDEDIPGGVTRARSVSMHDNDNAMVSNNHQNPLSQNEGGGGATALSPNLASQPQTNDMAMFDESLLNHPQDQLVVTVDDPNLISRAKDLMGVAGSIGSQSAVSSQNSSRSRTKRPQRQFNDSLSHDGSSLNDQRSSIEDFCDHDESVNNSDEESCSSHHSIASLPPNSEHPLSDGAKVNRNPDLQPGHFPTAVVTQITASPPVQLGAQERAFLAYILAHATEFEHQYLEYSSSSSFSSSSWSSSRSSHSDIVPANSTTPSTLPSSLLFAADDEIVPEPTSQRSKHLSFSHARDDLSLSFRGLEHSRQTHSRIYDVHPIESLITDIVERAQYQNEVASSTSTVPCTKLNQEHSDSDLINEYWQQLQSSIIPPDKLPSRAEISTKIQLQNKKVATLENKNNPSSNIFADPTVSLAIAALDSVLNDSSSRQVLDSQQKSQQIDSTTQPTDIHQSQSAPLSEYTSQHNTTTPQNIAFVAHHLIALQTASRREILSSIPSLLFSTQRQNYLYSIQNGLYDAYISEISSILRSFANSVMLLCEVTFPPLDKLIPLEAQLNQSSSGMGTSTIAPISQPSSTRPRNNFHHSALALNGTFNPLRQRSTTSGVPVSFSTPTKIGTKNNSDKTLPLTPLDEMYSPSTSKLNRKSFTPLTTDPNQERRYGPFWQKLDLWLELIERTMSCSPYNGQLFLNALIGEHSLFPSPLDKQHDPNKHHQDFFLERNFDTLSSRPLLSLSTSRYARAVEQLQLAKTSRVAIPAYFHSFYRQFPVPHSRTAASLTPSYSGDAPWGYSELTQSVAFAMSMQYMLIPQQLIPYSARQLRERGLRKQPQVFQQLQLLFLKFYDLLLSRQIFWRETIYSTLVIAATALTPTTNISSSTLSVANTTPSAVAVKTITPTLTTTPLAFSDVITICPPGISDRIQRHLSQEPVPPTARCLPKLGSTASQRNKTILHMKLACLAHDHPCTFTSVFPPEQRHVVQAMFDEIEHNQLFSFQSPLELLSKTLHLTKKMLYDGSIFSSSVYSLKEHFNASNCLDTIVSTRDQYLSTIRNVFYMSHFVLNWCYDVKTMSDLAQLAKKWPEYDVTCETITKCDGLVHNNDVNAQEVADHMNDDVDKELSLEIRASTGQPVAEPAVESAPILQERSPQNTTIATIDEQLPTLAVQTTDQAPQVSQSTTPALNAETKAETNTATLLQTIQPSATSTIQNIAHRSTTGQPTSLSHLSHEPPQSPCIPSQEFASIRDSILKIIDTTNDTNTTPHISQTMPTNDHCSDDAKNDNNGTTTVPVFSTPRLSHFVPTHPPSDVISTPKPTVNPIATNTASFNTNVTESEEEWFKTPNRNIQPSTEQHSLVTAKQPPPKLLQQHVTPANASLRRDLFVTPTIVRKSIPSVDTTSLTKIPTQPPAHPLPIPSGLETAKLQLVSTTTATTVATPSTTTTAATPSTTTTANVATLKSSPEQPSVMAHQQSPIVAPKALPSHSHLASPLPPVQPSQPPFAVISSPGGASTHCSLPTTEETSGSILFSSQDQHSTDSTNPQQLPLGFSSLEIPRNSSVGNVPPSASILSQVVQVHAVSNVNTANSSPAPATNSLFSSQSADEILLSATISTTDNFSNSNLCSTADESDKDQLTRTALQSVLHHALHHNENNQLVDQQHESVLTSQNDNGDDNTPFNSQQTTQGNSQLSEASDSQSTRPSRRKAPGRMSRSQQSANAVISTRTTRSAARAAAPPPPAPTPPPAPVVYQPSFVPPPNRSNFSVRPTYALAQQQQSHPQPAPTPPPRSSRFNTSALPTLKKKQ